MVNFYLKNKRAKIYVPSPLLRVVVQFKLTAVSARLTLITKRRRGKGDAPFLSVEGLYCEGRKELAHTTVRLQLILFSKITGAFLFRIFGGFLHVPTYYTYLLPHWRHK
jgi:hypothetical protein